MRIFVLAAVLALVACGPPREVWNCDLFVQDQTKIVDDRDITIYHKVKGECSSPYRPPWHPKK